LLKPFIEAGRHVLQQVASRQGFKQFIHSRQWYPLESGLAIG
jgi:hypothetical protein